MTEELKRFSGHGGEEDVVDRDVTSARDELLYFIYCELSQLMESGPEKVEPDTVLTDADRAALRRFGTPEQQAHNVCAQVRENAAAVSPKCESTHSHGGLETVAERPRQVGELDPDFASLLLRHEYCHQVERFEWSRQFVRERNEIGQGGQGTVYRIRCEDDRGFVGTRALKVLSPRPYHDAEAYHREMQRMRDVASIVHQNYHNNVIQVERFDSLDGIYVMVMRLIDGFDLEQLVQCDLVDKLKHHVDNKRWADLRRIVFAGLGTGRRRLAPGVAVDIILHCLHGAQALHDNGIVHGDIRPSNIMLDRHGCIRLIDINSAFHVDAPPWPRAWTPRYAPPEALERDAWTPQADVACLGYLLIELLSGQSDFLVPPASSIAVHTSLEAFDTEAAHTLDQETRRQLADVKRQLPDRLAQLIPYPARNAPDLMNLIRGMIHPDPDRRTSAADAVNLTAEFLDGLVRAHLAMYWVNEIQGWVNDTKNALAAADGGD